MEFDELFTKLKVNPLKLIESIVHADGSSLGNLASGTGLADLHWQNCISCLCIYDSGRVFSYS